MSDDKKTRTEVAEEEQYIIKVLNSKKSVDPSLRSKQLDLDVFAEESKANEIIPPLYTPDVWAYLMEHNTRYKRLVETMARNSVGLGVEIVPIREEEAFMEENEKEIRKEREVFTEVLDNIHPEEPLSEILFRTKTDEESTGYGGIEIVRRRNGQVYQLWHVPSVTFRVARVSRNRISYVQKKHGASSKKVFFKRLGIEDSLDAQTGKWEDEDIVTDPANELMVFHLYTPRSSFYGIPRIVSAAPAIAGTRLAHISNISFFENDSTPRVAIVVNGGELSDKSIEYIESFVDTKGRGPGNSGRLMLLQGKSRGLGDSSKVSIDVIPLTVGVTDDASFIRYISANNEEIREAFGIGQIFIGTTDDVNRAVALTMKQLTVEQVFDPEARRYETRLNKLFRASFGFKYVRMKLKRPRTVDTVAESQALSVLASAGGVTPNHIRQFLNKPKFTGKWADTPLPLLRLGLIEDSDNEGNTLFSEYDEDLIPPEVRAQIGLAREAARQAAGAAASVDVNSSAQNEAAKKRVEKAIDKRDELLREMMAMTETDPDQMVDLIKELESELTAQGFSVRVHRPMSGEELFEYLDKDSD